MNEARKPGTWAWVWGGPAPADSARKPISTRLPPQPELPDSLPGTVYTNPPGDIDRTFAATDKSPVAAQLGVDTGAEQQQHEWERVWEALTYDEKTQLSRLLRTARRGTIPSENDARDWKPLAAKLDQTWNELLTSQNRDVLLPATEISAERRRFALQALTELETAWNTRFKPAFDAAGMPRDWTAEQRSALAEIQSIVDAIAMAVVRDDTVWRADERTAWFRLIESLQESNPATLAQQSVGHVGFVQIFRQAPEYRGKVVTIRGTARMAYRVAAPSNDLGIREYCLFWIQPEDGTNLPIVVYALNPPADFPAVTTEQKKFHEQIAVTGYFFKRWVYRAADGLNTVPLIVAAVPTWTPQAAPAKTVPDEFTTALGPFFWPIILSGLAVTAVGIAWLINWSSRPSPVLAELRATADAAAVDSLAWDNLPAGPSIEESLRHLEDVPPGHKL